MSYFSIPQNLKFSKYTKKFGPRPKIKYNVDSYLKEDYNVGLCSGEFGKLSKELLDMCFRIIRKNVKYSFYKDKIKRRDDLFLCPLMPRLPLTKKPTGVRMGKGKGKVEGWTCTVKKNSIFFQFNKYVNEKLAVWVLKQVKFKLPFKSSVIVRKKRF